MRHLLLVDDEPAILRALGRQLRQAVLDGRLPPLRVEALTSPVAALRRAAERAFDLTISDLRMPALDGVQLLTRLRALQPEGRRLLLSAHADLAGLSAAINDARISGFLVKPWDEAALVATVARELAEQQEAQQAAALAEQVRLARGELSPQEAERRRLERLEPGITQVCWSSDGAYVLDPQA